jgi:lipopolysaccharide export system permease protein
MKTLHRYIRHNVITMTCLVVLIISGLFIFSGLVEEMRAVGRGAYNALQALNYVLLSLPHSIYPLFPVTALIGCLIALGRLASQSELLVMRASGVSKIEVLFSVIRTTILMLIVVTFIGEFIAPDLRDKAATYRQEAISERPVSISKKGGWIRDQQSFIYIERVLPDEKVRGILQYEFKDKQLVSATAAQNATYQDGRWMLNGVTETLFHPNSTSTANYKTRVWDVTFDPNVKGLSRVKSDQSNLFEIYLYIQHMKKGGLSASNYEFAFWKRLFQPLVTLVMIGLAVPFIFGPLRTVTMGFRVLVGVIVGFSFYTFNEFLGPFSLVYQIQPLLAASLPIIIFLVIDIYLFRRAV